jgi:hypothetical protein
MPQPSSGAAQGVYDSKEKEKDVRRANIMAAKSINLVIFYCCSTGLCCCCCCFLSIDFIFCIGLFLKMFYF